MTLLGCDGVLPGRRFQGFVCGGSLYGFAREGMGVYQRPTECVCCVCVRGRASIN